jgi:hypothetical protein
VAGTNAQGICCGVTNFVPGVGGAYGGGGGGSSITSGAYGAIGAVRIIWPGCARSFPSTRTANE